MQIQRFSIIFVILLVLIGCQQSESERAIKRGKNYLLKGQYTDAVAEFHLALKTDPQNAETLYLIGSCYSKLGDLNRTHEFFTRAIQIDAKWAPSVIPHYAELVERFRARNDKPRLIQVLSWLLEIDPGYDLEDNYYILGDYYYQQRDYENALTVYQQALFKMPEDAREKLARRRIIECEVELGDYAAAVAACDRYFERYSDLSYKEIEKVQWIQGQAAYYLAKDYLDQKLYDEAIEAAHRTIRLNKPQNLIDDAYLLLGQAYEAQNEVDKAREACENAIKANGDPSSTLAHQARRCLELLDQSRRDQ